MRAPLKRGLQIAVGILTLYLVVYVILSVSGGYVFTQSGQVRYDFGFSVSDLQQWQPRFAFCQRYRQMDGSWTLRANFLGYLFAPLILLDQAFIHKTFRLFDPETGKPTAQMSSSLRQACLERRALESAANESSKTF